MPPSSAKSIPSPSELAQLEHAFATDPSSDAYRPLAEAYLSMGRFMEAMVVCKKGVKAHSDDASARVLLARVYADQGKDKKALEELQGALQVAPNNVPALRMAGTLLCKVGETDSGTEHLKRAIAADPSDSETIDLCKKHKVALPEAPKPVAAAPVAPPPAPAVAVAPMAPSPAPVAAQPAHAVPAPQHAAVAAQAAAPQPAPRPRPAVQAPAAQRAAAPRPRPQPARASVSYEELAAKYGEPDEDERKPKKSGLGLIVTVAVILIGALSLGGLYFYRTAKAEREQKIDKLLKQIQGEIGHDSYAGYKAACELGESIVTDLDKDLLAAHAYLAYAYSIRWGEHGEGDTVQKLAREHLEAAKSEGREHSHLIAADAFIRFFGGDAQGAITDLDKLVQNAEQEGKKSPLLLSTLGILQTSSGDLEGALKSLKAAQTLAPADPRISAAVGNVYRRQGNEFLAANAYEQALRYEKNHAEAQLGVALMAVESNKLKPAEEYARKLLVADPPPSMRQLALARLVLAIVLDEQDKKAEADKEEMLAFESDPGNGELFILKSRRQVRAGALDGAVESIRQAIKLDPKRASFYVELARALIAKPGGAPEAVSSIEQALKSMPNTPKLFVLLGNAHRAAHDIEKAKESYEKALEQAIKNNRSDEKAEARMALADLAFARKDTTKAVELYEQAKDDYLLSSKHQAYALTQIGRINEESDRKKAFDFYRQALVVDSTHAPTYFFIGRLLASDKDKKNQAKAGEALEQYLKLAPEGEFAAEARKLAK